MIRLDDDTYCADGCRRPATRERLAGLTSGGEEVVELVCDWHAEHPEETT